MKLLKRTDGWTKNYECPTCKRFMTKTSQDLMSGCSASESVRRYKNEQAALDE